MLRNNVNITLYCNRDTDMQNMHNRNYINYFIEIITKITIFFSFNVAEITFEAHSILIISSQVT